MPTNTSAALKKLFNLLKRIMIITLIILAALTAITWLYMQQDLFGAKPEGERLARIKKSPNYKDGAFQNLSPTAMLAPGYSYWDILYTSLFKSSERKRPQARIPSIKTNLKAIPIDSNVLVWFGHSSYYMQIDGKRFLIDPVFSGNASPIPGTASGPSGSGRPRHAVRGRYALALSPELLRSASLGFPAPGSGRGRGD